MTAPKNIVDAFLDQFLTPGSPAAKPLPDGFERVQLSVSAPAAWPDGEVVGFVCHKVGTGPAVLLVHGWQSQAADMAPIALLIARLGYTVWLPDLPAHGHSEGQRLSVPLAGATVLEVARHAGPLAAVVSHSYGGAALVHALSAGMVADRAILVSPPTNYAHFLGQVAEAVGIPEALTSALHAEMQRLTGVDPKDEDMLKQVPSLTVPALFIHSDDDSITSSTAAEQVARAWPGACWHQVEGMGHFRLISDKAVLKRLLDFIGPGGAR